MRWFDRFLIRRSQAKGLDVNLAPGGFVTEVRDYRRPDAPRADTSTLQETQVRNELVFACIGVKATAARDPRLVVQTQTAKGAWEEAPGHPFRQLFVRPSQMMTESDLMRAAIVSWDVSNPRRAYFEKEYSASGLLIGLHPLNPALMRPVPRRSAPWDTIGYEWSDGRQRREYSLDELLVRSAPAWYDPPPLVAALGATESDSAQTDYVRAFFDNGGVPPGLLKYNMPLNDPQRDVIREKWRNTYGNRYGRSHDIGVLDSNVEYQQTGSKLDELQSQTLRSVAESRICMVFGVPPLIVYAYVGLLRATYSNLKEAWAGFWDNPMSPAFKEWRDWWTWSLLTEFEDEKAIRGERVRLYYDMSQVAALQDDVDAAQARAEKAWRAGGISRAEYRAALGFEPAPTDAFYLLPAGATAVPVNTAPVTPPKARARKALDDPGMQVVERRMEQALRQYLQDEYRQAAQQA
jgi:HK97 family phage portal protein